MSRSNRTEPKVPLLTEVTQRTAVEQKRRAGAALERVFHQEIRRRINEHIDDIRKYFTPLATSGSTRRGSLFDIARQVHDSLPSYCGACVKLKSMSNLDLLVDGTLRSEKSFNFDSLVIVELDKVDITQHLQGALQRFNLQDTPDADDFVSTFISDLEKSLPLIKDVAKIAALNVQRQYAAGISIAEKIKTADKSSIRFVVDRGRLAPERASDVAEAFEEHMFIANSLSDFEANFTIPRLHNLDKYFSRLLAEYIKAFNEDSPVRDMHLYFSGLKLRDYLTKIRRKYEDLDPELITELNSLILMHESYIWRFSRVVESVSNQHRTLESYNFSFDNVRLHEQVLAKNLSVIPALFDEEALSLFREVSDNVNSTSKTVGKDGIRHGLINGALRGMGMIVVMSRFTAISVSMNVVGNAVTSAVADTQLYHEAVKFLKRNYEYLNSIANDFPHDFSWIHELLDLIQRSM